MANKYLVWQNPSCNGKNIHWCEMNARGFFHFLNSDESNGRRFIMLDNDICPEADVIFIEATEQQYKEWYKDNCRHRYLNRLMPKSGSLSLDMTLSDNEIMSFHELVADVGVDVEHAAVIAAMINMLPHAISTLTQFLKEAIMLKYFKYPDKSDREIAETIGVNVEVFIKRRQRAIADLQNFFKK